LIGLILGFGSVILRTILFTSRKITLDKKYYGLIGLSLLGSAVGSWGYHDLISGNVDTATDYSQILSVLSLLAAGIIAGFFTFTFTQAADDERVLTSLISGCFVVLFYTVFAALSYYMGKSAHIHNAAYTSFVGPFIMGLLLVGNTLFDFWDYREVP
jgi:xanthine/uracil permease